MEANCVESMLCGSWALIMDLRGVGAIIAGKLSRVIERRAVADEFQKIRSQLVTAESAVPRKASRGLFIPETQAQTLPTMTADSQPQRASRA
jgi:hypothetical protein